MPERPGVRSGESQIAHKRSTTLHVSNFILNGIANAAYGHTRPPESGLQKFDGGGFTGSQVAANVKNHRDYPSRAMGADGLPRHLRPLESLPGAAYPCCESEIGALRPGARAGQRSYRF